MLPLSLCLPVFGQRLHVGAHIFDRAQNAAVFGGDEPVRADRDVVTELRRGHDVQIPCTPSWFDKLTMRAFYL